MLHWCLFSLLVLHLSGAASLPVHGPKGGSVFLPCNKSIGENVSVRLMFGPKIADGGKPNERFKGRVFESDHGDLIIKNLETTDAGKYTLIIYNNGHPISYHYEIHVLVNLTVRKGEELTFDYLPLEAETVEHCKGTVCSEIWRSGQGVLNDRLNDSNGRLVIREFNSSDAGIYRVLNSTGGELVTTNVTESGTESEINLNSTDDHRTDDTEQHYAWVWIVAPLALMALIKLIIKITRQHLNRNKQLDSYKVEMSKSDQVLKYSFVTVANDHENDDHNDGYCYICIPDANSRDEGDTDSV